MKDELRRAWIEYRPYVIIAGGFLITGIAVGGLLHAKMGAPKTETRVQR